MKKLITVKITQEQLSLLTTQLHREIGRLEEVRRNVRNPRSWRLAGGTRERVEINA